MAKTVKITERELNRIIQEEINDFKEPILTERRDGTLLVEMARINKNEIGDCIFLYNKWEGKIWSNDHNPPHFHIICNQWNVSFDIQSGKLMEIEKRGTENNIFNYMVANVEKWLSSPCHAQPKLTNRENATLIWEQLHDN